MVNLFQRKNEFKTWGIRIAWIASLLLSISCREEHLQTVFLKNPLNMVRNHELVILDGSRIFPETEEKYGAFLSVKENGREVPYQKLLHNRIGILVNFKPYEQKVLTIRFLRNKRQEFNQRAHGEISVRNAAVFKNGRWRGGFFENVMHFSVGKNHFIHDDLIRYEGPGLESDKIAYRIYLDKRNAIDVFGKKTTKMILPFIGHDTSTTYHKMNWWGMDILKVGKTFGAGSFVLYRPASADKNEATYLLRPDTVDSMVCNVLEDGPLRAVVEIIYKGWKTGNGSAVTVRARHFICAGSYLLRHEISVEHGRNVGIAFGIMQPQTCTSKRYNDDGYWQNVTIPSLAADSLNIFLYVKGNVANGITKVINGNRIIFCNPNANKVTFWSGALWQKNFPDESFAAVCVRFARNQLQRFRYPIQIKYSKDAP